MTLRFGSVCSGIESASVAWHPFGWTAAWFAEVDKAASLVLAYRFPSIDNHGDMTKLPALIRARLVEAPDVLVGGTPCQGMSIAGRRGGMADARTNLAFSYVDIADAIDEVRAQDGLEPCILVWENVPGALSMPDNSLGNFFAAIVGDDEPLEPGTRPEPGRSSAHWRWEEKSREHRPKWTNAGYAVGPDRAIAWLVKDAQYFGLAQRRARVFVVASAREGFDPSDVLFEFDGVRRDSAPRRETGEDVTHPVAPCFVSSGRGVERTGDTRGQDPVIACDEYRDVGFLGRSEDDTNPASGRPFGRPSGITWPAEIACTLNAHFGEKQGLEDQHINGGGVFSYPLPEISLCLNAGGMGRRDAESETLIPTNRCFFDDAVLPFDTTQITSPGNYSKSAPGDPCHPLAAGAHPPSVAYAIHSDALGRTGDALTPSPDSTGRIRLRPAGMGISEDVSFNLTAAAVHAVCVTGSVTHTLTSEGFDASEDGTGRGQPIIPAVGYRTTGNCGAYETGSRVDALTTGTDQTSHLVHQPTTHMAVRRLMPIECERLQGFPDNWTRVPTRHYATQKITKLRPAEQWEPAPQGGWWLMAADGPRYKQLGNSMATNCMKWIGGRIVRHLRNNTLDRLLG